MDSDNFEENIEQYEEQLKQIEIALATTSNEEERNGLLSLQNDIKQLLALTQESLSTVGSNCDNSTSNSNINTSPLDDEYALFMAEMAETGAVSDPGTSKAVADETSFADVEEDLKSLEGMKCQAPFEHNVEGILYHNAMVCSVIKEDNLSFETLQVRVLFTNPTHQEMIPCPYYLDGECKFSEDKCRYSHGEIVPLSSLKEYKEPNYSILITGCRVLAKQVKGKLWQMGILQDINEKDKKCVIKFETNSSSGSNSQKNIELDLHDILPLDEGDLWDVSDSDEDSADDSEEAKLYHASLIEQTLTNKPPSQALGDWEKHTKGIGSKLMQKMGYVVGTGLGPRSDGRIEPVKAQVLPAGKSLDHCMILRENAGGDESFFSVEKRMKKIQKRLELRNQKAYERAKAKTDVFSFINKSLSKKADSTEETLSKKHRHELKKESSRNLNVSSLKIEEDIRRIERDLWKINESLTRHKDPTSQMHKTLRIRLHEKQNELKNLKISERNVQSEQNLRKDKKKMTVF